MAPIRVRILLNKGRVGAPMAKLGKISEQAEKFLRSLAADCAIETRPGEWLAVNFKNGSVEYDATFQGDVNPGEAQVFVRNLEFLADYDPESEGLNGMVSPITALEYAKIGTLIDPDEEVGIGIYPIRGRKVRWRKITYSATASLRRKFESPLPSYGSVQGILHAWFKEAKEPYFQLRELATDLLVRVLYPVSIYSDVARAVQERSTVVFVTGNMLYDQATRAPSELRAEKIEIMRMMSSAEFEEFFGSAPDYVGDFDENGLNG